MDIQLILGANNSGKSKYAEEIAADSNSKLVYLATMVPQNKENQKRIEKHRIQRKDKGFRTIEKDWHIGNIEVAPDEVVLLEDATNLLANGIFIHGENAVKAFEDILSLAQKCKMLIVVSITGLSAKEYTAETAQYIEQINWLNKELEERASFVAELSTDETGKCHRIVRKTTQKNYAFFSNRACEFFPCHEGANPDDFNCLFCYCPLYVLGKECGGKYKYTEDGRKDCSACLVPHKKKNYDYIVNNYKKIEALMKQSD